MTKKVCDTCKHESLASTDAPCSACSWADEKNPTEWQAKIPTAQRPKTTCGECAHWQPFCQTIGTCCADVPAWVYRCSCGAAYAARCAKDDEQAEDCDKFTRKAKPCE